jgi:hypothetical protein
MTGANEGVIDSLDTVRLDALIARDTDLTEQAQRIADQRDANRDRLLGLGAEWTRLYGQSGPGRKQKVGDCTACHLVLDPGEPIETEGPTNYVHRPLADQQVVVFGVECSYCGPGDRILVPGAWIERRLTETEIKSEEPVASGADTESEASGSASRFVARFHSPCLSCEDWIYPGQHGKYVDGIAVHVDCNEPVPSGAPEPEDESPEWTPS